MIELLIGLAVLGVLFWLVLKLPMADPFPGLIRVVAIVLAIILVLRFAGQYLPTF